MSDDEELIDAESVKPGDTLVTDAQGVPKAILRDGQTKRDMDYRALEDQFQKRERERKSVTSRVRGVMVLTGIFIAVGLAVWVVATTSYAPLPESAPPKVCSGPVFDKTEDNGTYYVTVKCIETTGSPYTRATVSKAQYDALKVSTSSVVITDGSVTDICKDGESRCDPRARACGANSVWFIGMTGLAVVRPKRIVTRYRTKGPTADQLFGPREKPGLCPTPGCSRKKCVEKFMGMGEPVVMARCRPCLTAFTQGRTEERFRTTEAIERALKDLGE